MKHLYGSEVGSGDASSRIQRRTLDGVECSTRCADCLNHYLRFTLWWIRGGSFSLSGSLNSEAFLSAVGIGIYLSLCQSVTYSLYRID